MTRNAVRGRSTIVWLLVGGAIAVPGALLSAAAVAWVWASSTVERIGPPTAERIARTVPARRSLRDGVPDPQGAPAHLDIDLEDGVFEVRPGPPGSDVRIDGAYARGYYHLVHERVASTAERGDLITVRLQRARSLLIQLVAHAMDRFPSAPNDLTVSIPRGAPLSVDLTIRAGESRVDLGGLSLTDLVVDLAMGEHRLDFSEPLAVAPHRVRLAGGMGEIRFERLGNARAVELEAAGHMGSVLVDLGGSWPVGTVADLTLKNLMGELRLEAPDALRIVHVAEGAPDAEGGGPASTSGDRDPDAPTLRLHVSNTMGETRVTRY